MSRSISVIDTGTRKLQRNITVGDYPVFSCLYLHHPNRLLVTLHNYDRKDGDGRLLLIDCSAGTIGKEVSYKGPAVPSGIVCDDSRDLIYVADENLNAIAVHNAATLELMGRIPAGMNPAHLARSGDGTCLAVPNRFGADIMVCDLDTLPAGLKKMRKFRIRLGTAGEFISHPFDVTFSPDPAICYVTDFARNDLVCVDVRKKKVTGRIRSGLQPFGMALDGDREIAYVCNMGDGTVSVIDLAGKKKTGEFTGMDNPCHCALDRSGNQLIVTDQGTRTTPSVHFIDTGFGEIVKTITDPKILSPIGVTVGRRP